MHDSNILNKLMQVNYSPSNCRYNTDFTGYFYTVSSDQALAQLKKPAGWFLMAMVLRGPDAGIVAYHDTTLVADTTSKRVYGSAPGESRVFIGRKRVSHHQDYSSMMVDELTMWNRKLTSEEVIQIHEMYQN